VIKFKLKKNKKHFNAGILLIETMLYIVLSTILLTLLFQLALQFHAQSKLLCAQQIARNNLWITTDLLKRDLQKLSNLSQLTAWMLRDHKLYRQAAVRQVCMLEQVHEFKLTLLAPNLVKILLIVTCSAKNEQVTRLVYLRNFEKK